jgi:pyrimidine operon attenuation protein/uracil phosphoribosyltransferase
MQLQMNLPDAESLCADLVRRLRPEVTPETGMVGIHTGGEWLAQRLHRELGLGVPLGALDISFYRDDYRKSGLHRSVRASKIPFDVNGRHLLLVDDVLFTGRTVRAAMNELFDYGRPESIRLAALVDRGERQLPICAQYVGTTLAVPKGKMLRLDRDASGRLTLRLDDA